MAVALSDFFSPSLLPSSNQNDDNNITNRAMTSSSSFYISSNAIFRWLGWHEPEVKKVVLDILSETAVR